MGMHTWGYPLGHMDRGNTQGQYAWENIYACGMYAHGDTYVIGLIHNTLGHMHMGTHSQLGKHSHMAMHGDARTHGDTHALGCMHT
jgi:hypothetical protein